MGDQASIDRNEDNDHVALPKGQSGKSRILYDIVTLCEVQSALIRADLRHGIHRIFLILAVLIGSQVLLGGAISILLASASLGAADALRISVPIMLALVGSVAAVVALVGLWIAVRLVWSTDQIFKQSSSELRRNLDAIKSGLLNSRSDN